MRQIRFLLLLPILIFISIIIFFAINILGSIFVEQFGFFIHNYRVLIFTLITSFLIIKFKGNNIFSKEHGKSNVVIFLISLMFWLIIMSIVEFQKFATIVYAIGYIIAIVLTFIIMKYIYKFIIKILEKV